MSTAISWLRLFVARVGIALLVLLALLRPGAAERALPDPALLPGFNPLCDGSPLPCLRSDELAGHAAAQLVVLPATDRRDTAAVVPFGVTLGLFGRLMGGISTHYAFWREGDAGYQQLGPLRLNLTVRLLPLFPFLSSAGGTQSAADGPTHYAPPRGLQLGLSYQHEVRVWQFAGANSLGLLTDLAALRLVGSRVLGPLELVTSLGVLYDWRGQLGTGEAAAQLGLYLPGFAALKIYLEALGRGVPAYVRKDGLPPDADGQESIRPQGMIGVGLSFHPGARTDFGVAVQRGFGGLSPWAVTVQFLTLSVGKTYQGRAATPVAQLVAEVASEAAGALREFLDSLPIDPKLDRDCQIIDKDEVTVLGQFGQRTADGTYCEQDGFRVPIGAELNRDKQVTKLCRDQRLRDCLLERHGQKWQAVHRPRLHGDCRMTDSDGTVLGRLGEPSADGKRCRYPGERHNARYGTYTEYQELPIGALFYTDAARVAVCADAELQHCFMRAPAGRASLAWSGDERASTALLGGLGAGFGEQAEDARSKATAAARTAQDVATGKVKLSTVYKEARQSARQAVSDSAELLKDPQKRAAALNTARGTVERLKKAIADFRNKPPEEQLEGGLRQGGRLIAHGTTTVLLGGGTRLAAEGLGLAGTAVKGAEAEAAMVKAASATEHAGHAIADAAKLEKTTASGTAATNKVRHAGFRQNYAGRSPAELQKSIASIEKQIAEHQDKILNPEKHIPNWSGLDPRQRHALVSKKWPSDIERQKEQLAVLKSLQENRK